MSALLNCLRYIILILIDKVVKTINKKYFFIKIIIFCLCSKIILKSLLWYKSQTITEVYVMNIDNDLALVVSLLERKKRGA
jgi:hypothetical protein